MLSDFKKLTTVSAAAKINDATALFFNATIDPEGRYNVNKTIQNMDLYTANKTECDKDFSEFDEKVFDIAKGI